jgi:hypothetical protein
VVRLRAKLTEPDFAPLSRAFNRGRSGVRIPPSGTGMGADERRPQTAKSVE